eukprot:scaffold7983_cov63-Skeletonema_dohrnii-CCMP3373.AAC.1
MVPKNKGGIFVSKLTSSSLGFCPLCDLRLIKDTAATRGAATLGVACSSRFYSYSLPLAEESRHSEFKYSPQASSRM